MEIPMEILVTICAHIDWGSTYKAWRLVNSRFYEAGKPFNNRRVTFANGLLTIIHRHPTICWDWAELSANPFIPIEFIINHPGHPWDYKKLATRADTPWELLAANASKFLVDALRVNPRYDEFYDLVKNSKKLDVVCRNPFLQLNHLEKYDQRRCTQASMYRKYTLEYSKWVNAIPMWHMRFASWEVPLETIKAFPQKQWKAEVVARRTIIEIPLTFENVRRESVRANTARENPRFLEHPGWKTYKAQLPAECFQWIIKIMDWEEIAKRFPLEFVRQVIPSKMQRLEILNPGVTWETLETDYHIGTISHLLVKKAW